MSTIFIPGFFGGNATPQRPLRGVGMNGPTKFAGLEQENALRLLQPQRWHNWGHGLKGMEDERFTPTIWSPDWVAASQTLQWLATKYPQPTWLLLSEPDRVGQADIPAKDAVPFVRHWMQWLGDARTALAGVTVSPNAINNALSWLDDYLAEGGPLPDAWHIHLYAPSVSVWKECFARWKEWHQKNGQNKPVIMSETALHLTASSAEQIELMEYAYSLADLEAVYWYGAIERGTAAGLLTPEGTLTELGHVFLQL